MIDQDGNWIPELSPKGYRIFNSYKRYLLVHGPRKTTKTISICNKIMRHCFENENAAVCMLTKTIRNAKSFGVWQDMTQFAVSQWTKAKVGLKYTMKPRMSADTKMSHFRVSNMYGGESEVQLHSLDHERDVESKFKGTRFSLIYLSEADQFKDRIVFDILTDQLRVVGLPYESHQLIADCNPPEEGDEHWLHDVWFKGVGPDGTSTKEFKDMFEEIGFVLEDNTFMEEKERDELIEKYKYDKNKFNRYVLGLWDKNQATGHFADVYLPNVHVRGECTSKNEDDWQIIVPGDGTTTLLTGWDLGDINHAVSFACPRVLGEKTAYDLIDEVVVLHEKISIEDFTEVVLERMDYWEQFMKESYGTQKVIWRHWSDSSAMLYHSANDSYDELVVRNVSRGRIVLNGFQKYKESVKNRVSMLKKLLFTRRLFISAQLKNTISMVENLRPGKAKVETIKAASPEKHIFDAVTYMLGSESPADIERRIAPTVQKRRILFAHA